MEKRLSDIVRRSRTPLLGMAVMVFAALTLMAVLAITMALVRFVLR